MSKKLRPRAWRITVDRAGYSIVAARTPGAACRRAFKRMIADGRMKRQPETDSEGGFDRTHVELLRREP